MGRVGHKVYFDKVTVEGSKQLENVLETPLQNHVVAFLNRWVLVEHFNFCKCFKFYK